MKNKNAAMEMSVGTIVTIVLLMSMLVLGLVLIQNIFSSAKGAVDLTDQQLQKEIEKLFSEETMVVIYPTSQYLEIKQEESDAIGIGIRNLGTTSSSGTSFGYEVTTTENDCGLDDAAIEKWIRLGKSDSNIPIQIGGFKVARVTFQIPLGTPICLARFRAVVKVNGELYDSKDFDIQVLSK